MNLIYFKPSEKIKRGGGKNTKTIKRKETSPISHLLGEGQNSKLETLNVTWTLTFDPHPHTLSVHLFYFSLSLLIMATQNGFLNVHQRSCCVISVSTFEF